MLYCAVNLHFFFRAPSPRRNSTSNQNHASPQPASIQHLPHSHFPYTHNLFIPKHLRTLQKNTGGYTQTFPIWNRSAAVSTSIVVFSPRSSISRRQSQNEPLALRPALTPTRRLGVSRRRLLPNRPRSRRQSPHARRRHPQSRHLSPAGRRQVPRSPRPHSLRPPQ